MSFSLDPLSSGLAGLSAAPTYALFGFALRRMRSRDRLTVRVWGFCSAWAVGAGLWASWALGLAALRPDAGAPAPQFLPSWLGLLGVVGAAGVAACAAIARRLWPARTRQGTQTLAFTLTWALMLGCARLAAPGLAGPAGLPGDVLTVGLALGLVALGGVGALWLTAAERWHPLGPLTRRIWIGAVLLAACHTGALLLCLAGLRPGGGMTGSVDGHVLRLAAIAALTPVAVGLICAWLDSHAHRRNRGLAASLHEANARLREQALHDPMTRLPNRRMFEQRLEGALGAAAPGPGALAVLFIDLDGFKPVNDSFGHEAGDAVLREIGNRLRLVARPEDTLARVGGDEFLLMIVRPRRAEAAAAVARQVLQALGEPLQLPDGLVVRLSASIGIVVYPEHGPASRLVASADAAMYAAKRAGGATYAFFEPRMELDARDQLALQSDLRQALERQELQLYYQPKVDSRTGRVTGVESLLRWQHAVRGIVAPDRFIPVAERFGLIGAIGNWVIQEACRQLGEWQRHGLPMRVSVNLSVHQLRQPDLGQRVRTAVQQSGIDARRLIFEITESVAMEDTHETLQAFSELAEAGVGLAIDDFGTGYSSLAYLRKLPAQQLKIDRSFVQDLGQSPDALAVVDAVIRLAHALGLRVVAEGVETARQRDILVGLQCDELQGYLFARPMPPLRLQAWMRGVTPGAPPPAAAAHRGGQGPSDVEETARPTDFADTLPAPRFEASR